MEKKRILNQALKANVSSKSLDLRRYCRINRLILAFLVVAVVLAALPVAASAAVQFDGNKCYLSSNPESLKINSKGQLEWDAPAGEQLVIRLDGLKVDEIGDIARVRYLCKLDGPDQIAIPRRTGIEDPCPLMSTGNFNIGLFDSNGKGYIKSDGFGNTNDIWKGYLGYYGHVYPHVDQDDNCMGKDGKTIIPGTMFKRINPDNSDLFASAAGVLLNRHIGGFGTPLEKFVPLFIQAKRAGPGTIHFTITIDNVTYLRIEEIKTGVPSKMDVFSIAFPFDSLYTKVTLAPISAAKSLLKAPLVPTDMKHVNIYKEKGRFGGWPAGYSANQWIWGNEIMVAFRRGYYLASPTSHNADFSKPSHRVQARSLDGGETWTMEETVNTPSGKNWPSPDNGGINFTHPDFALKMGGKFSISYDRGRTWQGSYEFKGIDLGLTSRHDYMIEGEKECLFFHSSGQPGVTGSNHSDRSFVARTTDGGQTFERLGWLTDEASIRVRSVMPSVVRTSPTRLVAATRRKLKNDYSRKNSNWLEASVSEDNGLTWRFLSKIADTDRGEENGSPPAMVHLGNGRIAIAYGYRSWPEGIRAKISEDGGKHWSDEIVLRDDGYGWDLGYPRMVMRPDGKLVTMYYFNSDEQHEQHIVATIWDPDSVKPRR